MQAPANLVAFGVSVGIVGLSVVLLVTGRDILIPLALAVMIWYLLDALARLYGRIRIGSWRLPGWVGLPAALVTVTIALVAIANLIGDNIADVIAAAPSYQANLERLVAQIAGFFGFSEVPQLRQMLGEIDLRGLASNFAAAATGIVGNAGIIVIYVLFLLIEQRSFDKKMKAMFEDSGREKEFRSLLHHMQTQIQSYVWIKTLMSLLTGAVSYVILLLIGVDFAAFWAFVIFMLNYIPTIGSMLGVVFPALLTLVQFSSPVPFIIVVAALGVTQFTIGNFLEPRIMGTTLNLSPLVVILSLVIWGSLWGIVGAILCVPITVIGMIVFAHFEKTRPIAVLLSGNGTIKLAKQ
ncbi:MAG: AI-2E family transporter [Alphaproteobacteria bacterium]